MSDEIDANRTPTADDLRVIQRTRAEELMPEWARARTDSRPDPELKRWIENLRRKLFGEREYDERRKA